MAALPNPLIERLRARLGHDLRTWLTVIVGYASLLEDGADDAREVAAKIVEAAAYVSSAVDDLELVIGLASGVVEASPAPVDLREIVEAATWTRPGHDARPVDLVGADWPAALADQEHVTRAVSRIVTAACDRRTDANRICLSAVADGDRVTLRMTGASLGEVRETDLRLELAAALLELGGGALETDGDVTMVLLPLAAARRAVA